MNCLKGDAADTDDENFIDDVIEENHNKTWN